MIQTIVVTSVFLLLSGLGYYERQEPVFYQYPINFMALL